MELPSAFIERTKPLLKDEWGEFVKALEQQTPVSIRLNNKKNIGDNRSSDAIVPWCSSGYYLAERPQFTFDPLLHAGCYYVQEASSMFVEQAASQYIKGSVKVLDLCAAPGGKSTLLAGLLDKGSLLVSNEVIRSRAYILAENMTKWGCENAIVTNNDPAQIGKLDNYFDAILIDAPCSGEGMFRKDLGAVDEWSVDNVKLCRQRQQRILSDVWPALKPGGLLLYSTCTYNVEENEENVIWVRDILGAEILEVEVQSEWGISPSVVSNVPAYRFFPHKTQGEGLFFAMMRKNGNEPGISRPKNRKEKLKNSKNELKGEYRNYIKESDLFNFHEQNNSWIAFPKYLSDDFSFLRSNLNIISAGIDIGEFKGKDYIPHQSLALSCNLNMEAFQVYDIDWRTAINYLRKEPVVVSDMSKGFILLTYRNVPLGFIKNIGNRANNLYPQEWRIRSANIPIQEVKVL